MRIIGGRLKGRRLEAPKGRDVRPTSDRARESIFNLLVNGKHAIAIEGALVVDLFAGTGALGLEAISRGAGMPDLGLLGVGGLGAADVRDHRGDRALRAQLV